MYVPILVGVVIFVALAIFVEIEQWFATTVIMAGTVIGMHYFDVVNVSGLLHIDPLSLALYVLGYFAAGVVWSFVKWFSYLHRFRDELREAREKFRERYTRGEQPSLSRQSMEEAFQATLRGGWLAERPTAAKSRKRIIGWMTYWPISAISTALNDPVRRIFNALYNRFKVLYQKMADHVFRDEPDLQ